MMMSEVNLAMSHDYSTQTVTLSDGTRLLIRPVRPEDALPLLAMRRRLSLQSIYQRYMAMRKFTYQDMQALCQKEELCLVALDETGAIVGETTCTKLDEPDSDTAEFAILIEDAYQGRGLGRMMFNQSIACARAAGIRDFLVVTSGQNWGMIALVRGSGYPFTTHIDGSTVEFRMSLEAAKRDLKRAS